MNFSRVNDYHLASEPKGYTIVRIVLERGVLYELWAGKERVTHDGPHADSDIDARRRAVERLTAAAERHQRRTCNTEKPAA